ncbi:hypothetical protein [Streptomyces sp. HUAS TT7]|uniref:hypothetical protein n=1 Tax=Streptomyces sp. HUAS TT7 TaxID=3447507 RepID=UPI003F659589
MNSSHRSLTWTAAGAPGIEVRRRWNAGQETDLPIGLAPWEILRVTTPVAVEALARMRARAVPLGPVLNNPPRRTVEILVPSGTAAAWPALPGTRCVERGLIRCPPPHITAVCGRRTARYWIIPPGPTVPETTDSDALCEAVTEAIAHAARPFLPISPRRAAR